MLPLRCQQVLELYNDLPKHITGVWSSDLIADFYPLASYSFFQVIVNGYQLQLGISAIAETGLTIRLLPTQLKLFHTSLKILTDLPPTWGSTLI